MGRALRIEYKGAFYHITSRGNQAKAIFLTDQDRHRFIKNLQEAIIKFSVRIHGYVLMTNHYHLLLETPFANLCKCMHFINLAYTNYFNKRHDRIGHVLQGRYKSILIDKDNYLLAVSRYIHLNPVRAGLVKSPQDYTWSSYNHFLKPGNSWVWKTDILENFSPDRREAISEYRRFVEQRLDEKVSNPFREVKAGTILGEENFVEKALSKLGQQTVSKEISAYHKLSKKPQKEKIIETVARYFRVNVEKVLEKSKGNMPRKIAVYLAYKCCDCTLQETGDVFGGITYGACGKIIQRLELQRKTDPIIDKAISDLMRLMSNVKI